MQPYYIIFGVIGVLVIIVVVIYNSLIKKRNEARNAWADIEVQLKRRYDLIPNLVEAVRGYASHEKNLFERVTQARVDALKAQDLKQLENADITLSEALKNLFAVAENYPQLKASDNFKQLQLDLSIIESNIQSARRYYNAAVRELNTAIQIFPINIVAKIFNFLPADFFEAEENEKPPVFISFK